MVVWLPMAAPLWGAVLQGPAKFLVKLQANIECPGLKIQIVTTKLG